MVVQENVILNFMARGVTRLQQSISKISTSFGGFNRVMGMNMEQMRTNTLGMTGMEDAGTRLAWGIRNLTHGMRGFRMEMLGVMFFGMALQRFFSGLIKPASETLGIMNLWTETLRLVFLPVMLTLLEPLLKFMFWLMNLPEPVKKAIGLFVIFGAIVGGLLFIVGQFALGIGSLILVFGSATTGILVVVGALVALGVALYFGFKMMEKWKTLSDETRIKLGGLIKTIQFLSNVGEMFALGGRLILGIFKAIVGETDTLRSALTDLASFLGNFYGFWSSIWMGIKNVVTSVVNWVIDKVNLVIGVINRLISAFNTVAGTMGVSVPQISQISHVGAGGGSNNIAFNPYININATSATDVIAVRDALSVEWADDIERRFRRR